MENMGINLIDDLELKRILNIKIRFELYHFGSSLENKFFNDIDLLLVYNNSEKNNQRELLMLKRNITDYMYNQYHKNIDITVLSENEEEEKNFLDRYKRVSYHRFYEIERFVTLSEKLSERPPKADKN